MAHARWLLVALLSFAWAAEARAQLFVDPYFGGYAYRSGVRFKYRKRHLRVSGFLGNTYAVGTFGTGFNGPIAFYGPGYGNFTYMSPGPPFGVTYNRINVINQAPPTIVMNNAERQRLGHDV